MLPSYLFRVTYHIATPQPGAPNAVTQHYVHVVAYDATGAIEAATLHRGNAEWRHVHACDRLAPIDVHAKSIKLDHAREISAESARVTAEGQRVEENLS